MQILIWAGTAVTLAGLAGLAFCIAAVLRARRAGLSGAELKASLQRVVVWNLGALLLSAVGLMLVIVGVILG